LNKMNKDEIFAAWAPEASPWSTWTKPVLFAHLDSWDVPPGMPAPPDNVNWCPPKEDHVVVVVDLPGAEGALMGIALAERGYRPVPLYSAIPLPAGRAILDPLSGRNVAAVDVLPIIAVLQEGAKRLVQLPLASDAPPAFLLDGNRQGARYRMAAGEFDNRSICFTTDFPSANFLQAHGFRRALLVQKGGLEPQPDLAHVLRRWEDGGVAPEVVRVDDIPAKAARLAVPRPAWYGAMFQRALAAVGLRRAFGGGFGAWIPDHSAGG
jgi:hypothetical protein